MTDIVFINRSQASGRIPRTMIKNTIRRAELIYAKKMTGKNLSLVFVSPAEIKNLNNSYRKKDKVTNVLSFVASDKNELGDIIICPEIAAAEAKNTGQNFSQYVNFLFVHGLLHLLGFDHINESDAKIMEHAEKKLI